MSCDIISSFGIDICDHGDIYLIFKLLYKNICWKDNIKIEYDLKNLFDNIGNYLDNKTTPFGIDIDTIEFIPYDDLQKKITKLKINNLIDIIKFVDDMPHIYFGNISLIDIGGCHTILGFDYNSNNDNTCKIHVSIEEVKELQVLHNKLLKQGRIKGGFILVQNCCS